MAVRKLPLVSIYGLCGDFLTVHQGLELKLNRETLSLTEDAQDSHNCRNETTTKQFRENIYGPIEKPQLFICRNGLTNKQFRYTLLRYVTCQEILSLVW